MKVISLSISEDDYGEFRRVARYERRPVAQLIREAMAYYRSERLGCRSRLESLPVLAGHRPRRRLPSRHEIHDEIFSRGATDA